MVGVRGGGGSGGGGGGGGRPVVFAHKRRERVKPRTDTPVRVRGAGGLSRAGVGVRG